MWACAETLLLMRRLHIDAQADHVLRLAYVGDPVRAIIELIWNSLDAEATQVDVELERSDMEAIRKSKRHRQRTWHGT